MLSICVEFITFFLQFTKIFNCKIQKNQELRFLICKKIKTLTEKIFLFKKLKNLRKIPENLNFKTFFSKFYRSFGTKTNDDAGEYTSYHCLVHDVQCKNSYRNFHCQYSTRIKCWAHGIADYHVYRRNLFALSPRHSIGLLECKRHVGIIFGVYVKYVDAMENSWLGLLIRSDSHNYCALFCA